MSDDHAPAPAKADAHKATKKTDALWVAKWGVYLFGFIVAIMLGVWLSSWWTRPSTGVLPIAATQPSSTAVALTQADLNKAVADAVAQALAAERAKAPVVTPTPVVALPPAAPIQGVPNAQGESEWGDGRTMFKVGGTPQGYKLNSVDAPAKAAQCLAPKKLVRTNQCTNNPNGTITCKLDCQ